MILHSQVAVASAITKISASIGGDVENSAVTSAIVLATLLLKRKPRTPSGAFVTKTAEILSSSLVILRAQGSNSALTCCIVKHLQKFPSELLANRVERAIIDISWGLAQRAAAKSTSRVACARQEIIRRYASLIGDEKVI
jgi:hypothetical protein